MKAYLAGPIAGCTVEEAMGWRKRAQAMLAEAEITCLIPLGADEITAKTPVFCEDLGSAGRRVFEKDLFMIDQADIVLVNFTGWKAVSKGTLFELGYAYAKRKPIVAVGTTEDAKHCFIGSSCLFFPSVDRAAGYIAEMCGRDVTAALGANP